MSSAASAAEHGGEPSERCTPPVVLPAPAAAFRAARASAASLVPRPAFSLSLPPPLPTHTLTPPPSSSSLPGYIGEFEIVDDHRGNKIVINLTGRINKCGVISPRFDVPVGQINKWITNLLPSRQFGHVVMTTTYGIMDHEEARRKKTGGKVLGFFY